MSAWKNINKQDAYTTTYVAKKNWTVPSQSFDEYGIQVLFGQEESDSDFFSKEGTLYSGSNVGTGEYQQLVHSSLVQLYHKSYTSSSGLLEASSSYEHYLPTTTYSGSRAYSDKIAVISIPRNLFGTKVELGSFQATNEQLYVDPDYVIQGYFFGGVKLLGTDQGEVILEETNEKLGHYIPEHGNIVITEPGYADAIKGSPDINLNWKSNLPIYTYNYNVKLSDYEFNHTLNPTAQSGSNGDLKSNVTGSYFQPYITTVGLYNDSNELIAVGKLSQPLPKSNSTETTIQIKLDI